MNSNRLPGKVLMNLEGKLLLEWTIERLAKNNSNIPLAVITSNEKSDDQINDFCENKKIPCYRGNLNNVLLRYLMACEFFRTDYFIRISGDSPLIDFNLVDKAYQIHLQNKVDLITNILVRSFPKGQSVELISLEALKELNRLKLTKEEKEHVTVGFYNKKENFKIINFQAEKFNYSEQQQSIDTFEDLLNIKNMLSNNKDAISLNWLEIYNKIKNSN